VAGIVKTDDALDIIEIIDDDVDPFGDRASHTTIYDTGGPRWVGPVAAAALVGLIGYGVATSASTSSVPIVAPAPSTTVATTVATTVPAPSTTVPEPAVPYYAADPPREFVVQDASIQERVEFSLRGGGYQLWATPGATATSGSWFSIDSFRVGPQSMYLQDGYRVQVGEQTIAFSHKASGHTITQASVGASMSVTITSFGWSDDDLVRLVQSISAPDERLGNDVEIDDQTLIAGYEMLSTIQPWFAVQGVQLEQVYYASGVDPWKFVSIGVAERPPSSQGGSTLDRQIALRFFLDHGTPFEADGHVATAGEIIGQPGQSIATWIASDHIVTLSAQLPVQQLISIARTVHEVSQDVWDGMQFQAATNRNLFNDYEQGPVSPISFGTDSDARDWKINVGVDTVAGQWKFVNWQWTNGGYGGVADETAKVHSVVDNRRTYVVAELPRAIAPIADLRVTAAGLDPILVPFRDVDPNFDRTFAAYAFSEPGQYSAEIVGPDGAVLATWPTP
jgi:hypothetical protein